MTWNEVIEALGQEPEELDFVQEHKKYPATIQSPIFLSEIAQKAYKDAKMIQSLEPHCTITCINDTIDKIIKQYNEHKEKELTEIIAKYDFIVGSAELKYKLMDILPKDANIIYSNYISDPTMCYAIKKFNITDLLKENGDIKI